MEIKYNRFDWILATLTLGVTLMLAGRIASNWVLFAGIATGLLALAVALVRPPRGEC